MPDCTQKERDLLDKLKQIAMDYRKPLEDQGLCHGGPYDEEPDKTPEGDAFCFSHDLFDVIASGPEFAEDLLHLGEVVALEWYGK